MLLRGFNHVGLLTNDMDRLHAFYVDVFDAKILMDGQADEGPGIRFSIVQVGPWSELNVFQINGNTEATRQTPMFGRGRLDHVAFHADTLDAFESIRNRLMERGANDGFVTDFGPILSLFFRDPDGLECEVCVENPDAVPGEFHPPGTPARRYVS
jgi:catechol 2,3-dioxygenase-like lactoylglutathione lyase family enzyme